VNTSAGIRRTAQRALGVALAGFAALTAPPLGAALQVFTPSLDTSIYSDATGNANGAGSVLVTGGTGNNVAGSNVRRALLYFDLNSIAPGSIVSSASLQLSVTQAAGGTTGTTPVSLFSLTQSWGEGASVATNAGQGTAAATGDATWTVRFFGAVPSQPWLTSGGSFAPGALATASVGGAGTTATWNSALLTGAVQSWVDAPSSNFGWILVGNEAISLTARQFGSRENPAAALRPILTLDVTPVPEPGSFALLSLGLVALLAGIARARNYPTRSARIS